MISIYTREDTDYTKNGRAILHPTEAVVTGEAGGKYDLDLTVPKDTAGAWRLAATEQLIVKVPVPPAKTEVAVQGDDAEVWKVKNDLATRAEVRSQPKDDTIINYAAWGYPAVYTVGSRCTYNNHNYQLTIDLTGAEQPLPPPSVPTKWSEIARTKPGAPILDYLAAGTEFYKVEDYSVYWMRIQTYDGVEGYVHTSACVYVRTISAEDIEPRVITEQLFRIITVEEEGLRQVKDWCQHVSYDHNGVICGTCVINNAAPASAIARIKNALLWDPSCTVATNLKEEDGTFSATMTKKNLVSALLEPGKGIVSFYNARLIRDNWDFFIYRNTVRKSPIRLTYGGNITAIKVKRDTSKLYTRIRPIAKAADGKTDFFLEGATPWIDSQRITDYAAIRMLDLNIEEQVGGPDGNDGTWTEETLREYMEEKALEKFTVDRVDEPVITMEIDWLQLEKTSAYADFAPLGTLSQYDTVEVSVPPMGIEAEMILANFKWDAIRCRYLSTTFTNVLMKARSSVAGYMLTHGAVSLDNLSQEVREKLT